MEKEKINSENDYEISEFSNLRFESPFVTIIKGRKEIIKYDYSK
jgi:hypothetical protein